jgi:hypothetical protein
VGIQLSVFGTSTVNALHGFRQLPWNGPTLQVRYKEQELLYEHHQYPLRAFIIIFILKTHPLPHFLVPHVPLAL